MGDEQKLDAEELAQSQEEKEFLSYTSKIKSRILIGLTVAAAIYVVSIFLTQSFYSGDSGDLGTFGDFVGGVFNPFLSFLTVLLLVYSIKFQLYELRQTRLEVKQATSEHKRSATANEYLSNLQEFTLLVNTVEKEISSFEYEVYNLKFVNFPEVDDKNNPVLSGPVPHSRLRARLQELAYSNHATRYHWTLVGEYNIDIYASSLKLRFKFLQSLVNQFHALDSKFNSSNDESKFFGFEYYSLYSSKLDSVERCFKIWEVMLMKHNEHKFIGFFNMNR
ncbi:hypothetical protein [Bowmanella denitrificans]|uniref:hypothetical protein n=1 Tax=Bowmanella denitrificans TaxID=366582 RepID=UPI0011AF1B47|nr:hypothetical protein [Bowmanella denitrificans]